MMKSWSIHFNRTESHKLCSLAINHDIDVLVETNYAPILIDKDESYKNL